MMVVKPCVCKLRPFISTFGGKSYHKMEGVEKQSPKFRLLVIQYV